MECMTCATDSWKNPFLTFVASFSPNNQKSLERNRKKIDGKINQFQIIQVNPTIVLPNRNRKVDVCRAFLFARSCVFFVERCNGLSRIWKACRFLENEEQLRLFEVKECDCCTHLLMDFPLWLKNRNKKKKKWALSLSLRFEPIFSSDVLPQINIDCGFPKLLLSRDLCMCYDSGPNACY